MRLGLPTGPLVCDGEAGYGMAGRKIWLGVAFAAVSMLTFATGASGATPGLGGEQLFEDGQFQQFTRNGECDDGTGVTSPLSTSTVAYTYQNSGVATGPYAGLFTETGSFTLGPEQWLDPSNPGNGGAVRPMLAFNADFQITTYAGGQVTGTKVLAGLPGDLTTNYGYCAENPTDTPNDLRYDVFVADFSYQARIQSTGGDTCDAGSGFLVGSRETFRLTSNVLPGQTVDNMSESFVSTAAGPCSPPPPALVALTPPDAVSNVGTTHTVTATVDDAAGVPVQGAIVRFSVQGSVTTSGTCTTAASGQCSFTYQGPQLPGADVITGCADSNSNGTIDPGEPCATATKAWLLPTTTPGQVTGGGQTANNTNTDQIAFGFTAKSDAKGTKGECNLVDPSTHTKFKCLDVTTLVESGTHATFFGNGTVDGVATTYRIDVDDNGEPGRGSDIFKIQTASGYTVGGIITSGNIQVN